MSDNYIGETLRNRLFKGAVICSDYLEGSMSEIIIASKKKRAGADIEFAPRSYIKFKEKDGVITVFRSQRKQK